MAVAKLPEGLELSGFAQLSWSSHSNDTPWLGSWLREGTGVTRFDEDENGLQFNQALLEASYDVSDHWSAHLSLLGYDDGDQSLGVTEAHLDWSPLGDGWKQRLRIGLFYPVMSLENVGPGWHSPYTYTFSAINSWLGEELRVAGAEYQWTRPGRRYNSPHTYTLVGSVFAHNDGNGTLLAWRGWALHDRQTLAGERVAFANYLSFRGMLERQPNWVEPLKETDDRPGYYLGGHWRYQGQSDVRLYYYDNRGDGGTLEPSGQYAWNTRFTSLAWQYRFNRQTRLLAQWMQGATEMGNPTVELDFSSWYLMLSHRYQKHRLSLRYDWFDTTETDHYPMDPNDSQGDAWTLTWRYPINKHLQVGAEYLEVTSDNENRRLWYWPTEETQRQLQLVLRVGF
jgi:hypothetical protein